MKVLIIPEDPVLDRYILKPVVERIFADLGRSARIDILTNPRNRGIAEALNPSRIKEIIETHPMIDLFLILVDRDCDVDRRPGEARAREELYPDRLFACLAIEEIEVWMLAIHRDSLPARWNEIRAECHPKERFVPSFLAKHELELGRGRVWAMRDLKTRWKGVLEVCPELGELSQRLRAWLARTP